MQGAAQVRAEVHRLLVAVLTVGDGHLEDELVVSLLPRPQHWLDDADAFANPLESVVVRGGTVEQACKPSEQAHRIGNGSV